MLRKPYKTIKNESGEITLEIYGNNHRVELLYFWELSPKWQKFAIKEKDWLFDKLDNPNNCEMQFFIHKNWLYSLDEFERTNHFDIPGMQFDGYMSDSFFSGILIRYLREEWGDIDPDFIQVYTYLS